MTDLAWMAELIAKCPPGTIADSQRPQVSEADRRELEGLRAEVARLRAQLAEARP